MNAVRSSRSAVAAPIAFTRKGEGEGEGDSDRPCGYPYRLDDADAVSGACPSGLVCARRRRRSGSRITDDDVGDVSASVLSG